MLSPETTHIMFVVHIVYTPHVCVVFFTQLTNMNPWLSSVRQVNCYILLILQLCYEYVMRQAVMLNTPEDDSLLYHVFLPFLFILLCTLIPRQFLKKSHSIRIQEAWSFHPVFNSMYL